VKTRYFISKFLGHAAGAGMQAVFQDATSNFNLGNLIQLSMDGPSVNWSFHDKINVSLEQDHSVSLLNVGNCALHKVLGAFETATHANDLKLDKTSKAIYTLFSDTPARREDYITMFGTTTYPLEFYKLQ